MRTRVNITLPQDTLSLLDKVAGKGKRSRLVEQAIRYYLKNISQVNLRKRLKEGALRHFKRDLRMAEEWFSLEDEAWQKSEK